MSMALDFTIRLLVAALMGGLIGYERELRGKVAGIRTHLLVAVGSCLFMIISQYGFEGADKFDAARVAAGVAAGVVGGLGFLGGGIIMKNKHVSGLTTAAGIWVTGAIGMALGSGMYELAGFCFVLLLICVEFLYFFTVKLGDMQVNAVLSAKNREDIESAIRALGKDVNHFSWSKDGDRYKADITLVVKKKAYPEGVLKQIGELHGVELESLD